MRYYGIVIGLALTLLGAVPVLAQDGPRWSLSTSVNYSKGDYGTGEDTELLYVPFTFGVRFNRFAMGLTVPYLRQTSQTVTVTGGGVAVRKDKQARLATAPGTVTSTEDGLGDILLRGSFVVLEERPWLPEIEPYLKVKFPTADEGRGLGTGEFDETLGVDLSKSFLERLTGYLTLAYTVIGSPPGVDFDNSFGWSLGAAYTMAPSLSVFSFLDGATAISAGQDGPLDLRVGAELRLTRAWKLTGSVAKGLSDGSADWGFSAGLALRY
jgi:hypothetical protein